jgi:hypothetical protein
MLHDHPNDAYLTIMVGKCMNELYRAQKAHELSKVADLPNKAYDAKYNSVLYMIQNLRLSEIAALSYYFLKKNETALSTIPDFEQVYATSKQHFNIQ